MQTVASSCAEPVSREDFRSAMARLAAAVHVITTDGPAGPHGMTATALCSVSDDPASLLLCVNHSARMHEALVQNRRFCVNTLAAGQEAVSGAFAQKGLAIEERLASAGEVRPMASGVPGLAGALVLLDCRVEQVIEAGTHSIFLAHVEQIVSGNGQGALLYFDRAYHAV